MARWRAAERAWITVAIVVACCTIAIVLSTSCWIIWQLWRITRG